MQKKIENLFSIDDWEALVATNTSQEIVKYVITTRSSVINSNLKTILIPIFYPQY